MPAVEIIPSFDSLTGDLDKDEDGELSRAEFSASPFGEHFGWADADKDDNIDAAEWKFIKDGMSSRDYGLIAIDFDPDGEERAQEAWRYKRSLPSIPTPIRFFAISVNSRS